MHRSMLSLVFILSASASLGAQDCGYSITCPNNNWGGIGGCANSGWPAFVKDPVLRTYGNKYQYAVESEQAWLKPMYDITLAGCGLQLTSTGSPAMTTVTLQQPITLPDGSTGYSNTVVTVAQSCGSYPPAGNCH